MFNELLTAFILTNLNIFETMLFLQILSYIVCVFCRALIGGLTGKASDSTQTAKQKVVQGTPAGSGPIRIKCSRAKRRGKWQTTARSRCLNNRSLTPGSPTVRNGYGYLCFAFLCNLYLTLVFCLKQTCIRLGIN